MKEITIKVPDGKKPVWNNGTLKFVDESITERIKTFEDAVNELGFDNELVREYYNIVYSDVPSFSKDLLAYLKLRIIVVALNEGWEPQFTKDEKRYSPWFRFLTKEQYDKLADSEKRHCVLFHNNTYSNYGFTYFRVYNDASHLFTVGTLRLVLRTKELVEYAGKQFVDLWFDYLVN